MSNAATTTAVRSRNVNLVLGRIERAIGAGRDNQSIALRIIDEAFEGGELNTRESREVQATYGF